MQEEQDPPTTPALESSATAIKEGKTTAIISYLTVIGLVIALIMNGDKKNTFAGYHIRQSFGLVLTSFAISFISWIPFIGWLIAIAAFFFLIVLWFTGLFNAMNGKEKPVAILGKYYEEWLKST